MPFKGFFVLTLLPPHVTKFDRKEDLLQIHVTLLILNLLRQFLYYFVVLECSSQLSYRCLWLANENTSKLYRNWPLNLHFKLLFLQIRSIVLTQSDFYAEHTNLIKLTFKSEGLHKAIEQKIKWLNKIMLLCNKTE